MHYDVELFKDKLKAFFIHLAISLLMVLAAYFLINLLWYPTPLFKATDVSKIFIMILLIDLILGPLLTFVVYKKNKKTLKMDLTVIVLIQLSALAYGLYSVYQARPVWIAYVVDRFELVRANDILEVDESTYYLPKLGPEYIYVDLSRLNASEKLDSILDETTYNISPAQRPKFYNEYDLAKPLIIKNSKDIIILNDYNNQADVENTTKKYPQADSFLPLKANAVDMTALIDRDTGKVIEIVDLRPW
ncbi:TfpX/TfpZ family type IV pilin accessory protein [Psychrobacter okhotskensis]|uniref:TfpX/TfpZ family type IV pilin accessory protein n=1 Tax=Psychrobacter okhotskensis TaxID=212403 RepID=UPI001918B39C|nr:TfpX/TfpZ family type IV pilin accessory protein [Psychrobacter okhotskensis]